MIIVRLVIHRKTSALFSSEPRTMREIYTSSPSPFLNKSMEQHFEQIDKAKARGASRPKAIFDPASSMELQARVNNSFQSRGGGGIPAPLIGIALGLGAGATIHYFWRKRKSKNGKQIVERVRR